MGCKSFSRFDNYSEEDLNEISGFLSQYGKCLSMELTGMNKEDWLRYHKANMPENILEEVEKIFEEPMENLIKYTTVDMESLDNLEYFEKKKVSVKLALHRDTAKFRLEKGV